MNTMIPVPHGMYWLARALSILIYLLGSIVILKCTATSFDITEEVAWVYLLLLFLAVDTVIGFCLLVVFTSASYGRDKRPPA